MSEIHNYEVNLTWDQYTKGTLSSPLLPSKIEVATPPDFPKGMVGIWSPEHLFIAAVNACLMATFLAITDNSKIEFINYESNAIGKVEKVDGKFIVTEITITPNVIIPASQNEERIKRVFEMSEKACAVSNSIKSKINLNPIITVG